jgi:cardiolipin synthase
MSPTAERPASGCAANLDGVAFSADNRVEIFSLGASGLEAMLRAVRDAKRWIHLETYILRNDATGRRFLEALAERASCGVRVRLLYDDFGARGVGARLRRSLRRAGVAVAIFNPLGARARGPRRHRDHRKILVVDGEVGFTGGLNIADECHDGTVHRGRPLAPWRDLQLRIAGPSVAHLNQVFLESWELATGEPAAAPVPGSAARGAPGLAVLPDGPTGSRARLHDVLCELLGATRRRTLFVTPYFLPGARVRRAMTEAAARGVDVQVLVAGDNDHPLVACAVRSLLPPFLEGGVRVFEYEGALMHAKAAVFDDDWAIVGSSNFDQQSFHHSYEVNVLARGGELPRRLAALLRADLAQARPVTAASLAGRPWWERSRDAAVAAVVKRL